MKLRPVRIDGDTAYIPLSKGYEAIIDLEDAHLVDGSNWTASVSRRKVYAVRTVRDAGGRKKHIYLHRVVARASPEEIVDHRNHDGLDNRSRNLRKCNRNENQRNQRTSKANTVGLKGVTMIKSSGRFQAQITVNGERKYLGVFSTKELAHSAYREASRMYHGEYGCYR